jgi:hypothetical protein
VNFVIIANLIQLEWKNWFFFDLVVQLVFSL